MNDKTTTHPIFHLAKLQVATNVPLEVIEELFVNKGLARNTFGIYLMTDKDNVKYIVLDYPVNMSKESYYSFIDTVTGDLDILSKYYSNTNIIEIIKRK